MFVVVFSFALRFVTCFLKGDESFVNDIDEEIDEAGSGDAASRKSSFVIFGFA